MSHLPSNPSRRSIRSHVRRAVELAARNDAGWPPFVGVVVSANRIVATSVDPSVDDVATSVDPSVDDVATSVDPSVDDSEPTAQAVGVAVRRACR